MNDAKDSPPRGQFPRRSYLRPVHSRVAGIAAAGFGLAAAGLAQPAGAEIASGDTWRVSGFGTLGLMHAETKRDWLFARDSSQQGAGSDTSARPDSRLGLQLNWQPSAEWEGVVQVVARQRVDNTRADEPIEMGFVAWHPTADWTLRAGRIKPDLFLLHNSRNVGYSMPWVRPNSDFYGWIPGASLDGVAVSHDARREETVWSSQLWLGRMRETVAGPNTNDSFRWSSRRMLGLTLTRHSGALTLKASVTHTKTDLGQATALADLNSTLLAVSQLPTGEVAASARQLYLGLIPHGDTWYTALGTEYDNGPWLMTAELNHVSFDRGTSAGLRGYVSIGRRIDALTVYAISGFSQPDQASPRVQGNWEAVLTPYLGPANAAAAAQAGAFAQSLASDARFDQSSLGLGVRWDAFSRVALKTQIEHFRVERDGAAQWRRNSNEAGNVTVVSAVIDWVF